MIQAVFGKKQQQSQFFLEDGARIPVTPVVVVDMPIVQVKTAEKDGYAALQVALGTAKKKHMTKAALGHIKKSGQDITPRFFREIRLADAAEKQAGEAIVLAEVLKPGDIVKVSGVSKGKGFAGGVKRHGFHGGPKTHGQSDRHRAPGAIGQGTTPGRVYKGKRMAGRMGHQTATLQNLLVVAIDGQTVYVKGLLPGSVNNLLRIEKTGEAKNFTPPFSAKTPEPQEAAQEEVFNEPKDTKESESTVSQAQSAEGKDDENGISEEAKETAASVPLSGTSDEPKKEEHAESK